MKDLIGEKPREAWAKFDLQTADVLKIGVKSAAYLRSAAQEAIRAFGSRTVRPRSVDCCDQAGGAADMQRANDYDHKIGGTFLGYGAK